MPATPISLNCNVRKAMESLKMENRSMIHFEMENEHIWLIGANGYSGDPERLRALWDELEEAKHSEDGSFSYTNCALYKLLRSSFYTLKKSDFFPGYVSYTCPEGIKDKVCKHSVMLMEKEHLIDSLPQPLEGRQKRGRKRKVGSALERI